MTEEYCNVIAFGDDKMVVLCGMDIDDLKEKLGDLEYMEDVIILTKVSVKDLPIREIFKNLKKDLGMY